MTRNNTRYDKNRFLSYKNKSELLIKQKSKCANSPGSNLHNIENYECRLWKHYDGTFDPDEGFEADHIIEYCVSKDTSVSNMQLLCPSCHRVKTKNFLKNKKSTKSKKLYQSQSNSDASESLSVKKHECVTDNAKTNNQKSEQKVKQENIKKFRCKICDKGYTSKRRLESHVDTKGIACEKYLKIKKPNNYCKYCDQYLGSPSYLKKHIIEEHNVNKNTNIIITNNSTNKTAIDNSKNNNFHNSGDANLNPVYNNNNNKIINNYNKIINNYNIILNHPPSIFSYDPFLLLVVLAADNPLIKFIKKTLVNKNTPQFHNIICASLTEGKIYKDDEWIVCSKDQIANFIIGHFNNFINTAIEIEKKNKSHIILNLLKEKLDCINKWVAKNPDILDVFNILSKATSILKETRKKCHNIEITESEDDESETRKKYHNIEITESEDDESETTVSPYLAQNKLTKKCRNKKYYDRDIIVMDKTNNDDEINMSDIFVDSDKDHKSNSKKYIKSNKYKSSSENHKSNKYKSSSENHKSDSKKIY